MTVVTEEEANGRWCPSLNVDSVKRHNFVFAGEEFYDIGCVGSKCMAWRWVKGNPVAGTGRGYCGLAGRP